MHDVILKKVSTIVLFRNQCSVKYWIRKYESDHTVQTDQQVNCRQRRNGYGRKKTYDIICTGHLHYDGSAFFHVLRCSRIKPWLRRQELSGLLSNQRMQIYVKDSVHIGCRCCNFIGNVYGTDLYADLSKAESAYHSGYPKGQAFKLNQIHGTRNQVCPLTYGLQYIR